jgi:PAS domain S-box-containing protein
MTPVRRSRGRYLALAVAIAIFVASLGATVSRLYTIDTDVAEDFGESLVWSMAQNESELLRLMDALRGYGDGEPGATSEELQNRFDLLWSRLSLLREGGLAERLRAIPGAVQPVEAALMTLARLEPQILALPPGDAAGSRTLRAELARLLPELHRATLAASQGEIARLTARSDELHQALLMALGLLVGLVLSAGMLVALLMSELRLGRALTLKAGSAEAEARKSEQRFRDVVEAGSDWVWETDADDRFVFLSGRLRQLSGEEPKRVLGRQRQELRLPDDRDDANWAWYASVIERRQPYRDFEFLYGDAGEERRWARVHGRPVFDAENRFMGYRGTGRDITAERAASAAIAESRELLRAVIDAVPAIVNVKDRASRYILMNRFQGEVYGVDPAAAVGKVSADFTGADYGGWSLTFDREVVETGSALPFREREFVGRDGRRRVWWTAKRPLKDAAGEVRYIVTVALDITELKATERARVNLARYISPNLVDLLAAKDEPIGQVRRQEVAVVFADLVGFTRLSARETPERTMSLLRDLHARLTEVVLAHGGTLEKFLGDGLMATFGTPASSGHDAGNALRCTVAMIDALAQWNQARVSAGEQRLGIGIGGHFGPVILGDIGTDRRLEYAVVGDTVNIASRLEAMTRRLGSPAVVSRALVEAALSEPGAPPACLKAFAPSAAQVVDGHDEKIEVFVFDPAGLPEDARMNAASSGLQGVAGTRS